MKHPNVATCTPNDIGLTIQKAEPAQLDLINKYFERFAAPIIKTVGTSSRHRCPSCDEPVDAFLEALGMGVAHRWGLAHGEASCSGCGYPSRGNHSIKDETGKEILGINNLFLFYHPSQVKLKKKEETEHADPF